MADSENKTNTVGENALRPASIRNLYEGMIVQDNIFDASGDRMLMSAGGTLTADQIDRMHRLNGGSDKIYVSGRTHKAMVSKRPNIEIDRLEDIENSSGYTESLSKVGILYTEILNTKKVNSDGFSSLATEVSQIVRTTDPSVTISLINAIAPIEEHLYRHLLSVGLLAGVIGLWLGLPNERIDKLVLTGLLHDCGHALVPQPLLHSARKFTRLDFETIKMHAVHTEKLLSDFPGDVRSTAASHHERLDGSGYPKGIASESLTEDARILAISDIYEGIVTARPHRSPRSPLCALSMFDNMASVQIDSNIVGVIREKLPPLLIDKPVTMSDGTIGILRKYDPNDIKYPNVEISKRIVKTNENLYCVSMYTE